MVARDNVLEVYQQLLKEGKSKKDAAKTAQSRTGVALRTGKPFKRTHRTLSQIGEVRRQYA